MRGVRPGAGAGTPPPTEGNGEVRILNSGGLIPLLEQNIQSGPVKGSDWVWPDRSDRPVSALFWMSCWENLCTGPD